MECWWKDAVIYAVDVERFYDSNGDGIGDFSGLTEKLDYIADLGITCIWLLPFYSSTNQDNGYDITGYFNIDPRYGTLDDFIAFVHRAGELGLRIIVDLVTNHTSNKHPWFEAARQNEKSRYRNYYYWAANPPPTPPGKGTIFPGEEDSVWTYDEVARAYYYHRFYHFEPSLNTNNPDVRAELERVLDFWMSFGISGVRVDAAAHMVEAPSPDYQTMDDPHDTLREVHKRSKEIKSDSVLIGEVDENPEELKEFLDGRQLDMMFNFLLNNYLFFALASQKAEPVERAIGLMPPICEKGQWANFLRNFDEVDLEQLSGDERQQVFEAFAPKENMQIYGRGMRRRLAPALGGNIDHIKLAYALLFALPGAPSFVYGDEIGMGEDLSQQGRFSVRSPMQWDDKKNAGFSSASKTKLVQPVIDNGKFSYHTINAAAQKADDTSLYHMLKTLCHLRREMKFIRQDNLHVVSGLSESILGLSYKKQDQFFLAIFNLADKSVKVSCDVPAGVRKLINLLDKEAVKIKDNKISCTLPPYGFSWLASEDFSS